MEFVFTDLILNEWFVFKRTILTTSIYAGQMDGDDALVDIFFSLIARYASTHLQTYSYCSRVCTMYRLKYSILRLLNMHHI
jgi:hypothetical protein